MVDEKADRGTDQEPRPDDYEFGEADSRYIADLAKYESRRQFAELQSQQAFEAEIQAIESRWSAAIQSEEITSKYADFDQKVTEGAAKGTWDCSPLGALLIKNSEVGPDIAYHLASNPAESKRIAALDPSEQLLEIGRLEGRFLYAREAAQNEAPKPKLVTDAPPPPADRSRGAGGKFVSDERALYRKMLSDFK